MADYTLTFTEPDLQVVNDALIQLPFRVAAPLIGRINEQILRSRETDTSTQPDAVANGYSGVRSLDERHDG